MVSPYFILHLCKIQVRIYLGFRYLNFEFVKKTNDSIVIQRQITLFGCGYAALRNSQSNGLYYNADAYPHFHEDKYLRKFS